MAKPVWLGIMLVCLIAVKIHAGDWPQYNGPLGNRSSDESIGPIQWPIKGPSPHWRIPTSNGFSSFTVVGGKMFTLVSRKAPGGVMREVCAAFDITTGRELWSAWLGEAFYDSGGDSGASGNTGGDGPRSTPTCDGEFVYAYDAYLCLYCFNAADGKLVWKQDILNAYAGRLISWQNAASPLLEGELVVVGGGGSGQSLLAFNRKDGQLVWKTLSEKMTHATPVAATIQDVRQIIFLTQTGLVSVAPDSGAELWRFAFPYNTSTAASPVVSGDLVYCSAGYNVGAVLCQIARNGTQWTATQLWRKSQLMNHWSTPVCRDGYLYGLFGAGSYGTAPLKCIELATGNEKWSEPGFGQGSLIAVGNHLVVLADDGEIAIVEATPGAYQETARAKMLAGKCWSSPTLSNNRIYARSTTEGISFDLSVKTAVKSSSQDYP